MANTRLTRTLGTPTNRKKLTASLWVKKSFNGVEKHFFGMSSSGGYLDFRFASTGELELYHYNSGYQFRLTTTRKFRDTNGWLHLVFTIDTTLATADDRFKVYVNGVQETVFTNRTNPSQDYDIPANISGNTISVGNYGTNTGNSFDGIISHVHFSDGYAYDPTPFGETDSTTGEWKIKTSVTGVTYGTNGFWWLKDSIAPTDHSPNSNTFTVASGTLTKTEDNPSNVFATLNPISGANTMAANATFSNGNNTVLCSGSVYNPFGSTIGVNKGKWYAEFKTLNEPGDGMIGIFAKLGASGNYIGSQTHQYSWYRTSGNVGRIRNNSNDIVTGINGYTTNDIIGIALDCDNNKLYMHKNGTYISNGSGTGDPTNGNYGISITDPDDTDLGFYFMTAMDWGGSGRGNWSANFGNGYFGTTAVSSAGTNASGNGIFEYDVPTGFTALSTKGLNL